MSEGSNDLSAGYRKLLKGWQVKYSKVAVVVAGSVMAVGAGAPAFADSHAAPVPTSLNGGVDELVQAQPVQKAVDGTHVDSALGTAGKAARNLQGNAGGGALLSQATGATRGGLPALLGGLPVASLLGGGLPLAG